MCGCWHCKVCVELKNRLRIKPFYENNNNNKNKTNNNDKKTLTMFTSA